MSKERQVFVSYFVFPSQSIQEEKRKEKPYDFVVFITAGAGGCARVT